MLGEASQLLGTTMGEIVPPEAQVHLLNAQRELLLALQVTLDHHLRKEASAGGRKRARRPVRVDIQ